MVGKVVVGLLVVAMIAWALCAMLVATAQAHTLSMSAIKRGIIEAVRDEFRGEAVHVRVVGCHRIDRHSGECAVRVYLKGHPRLPMWCGTGDARAVGKREAMRARGSLQRCPGLYGPGAGHPAA